MRTRILNTVSQIIVNGVYITTVRINRVIRSTSGSITLPDRTVLRFAPPQNGSRVTSTIIVTSNAPIVPPFNVDLRLD